MQLGTQEHVEGYLRSAGYNLLNTEKGFIVADQPGMGGDRDTLLVWIPSQLFPGRTFEQLEISLLKRIESEILEHPNCRYTILVSSTAGISRGFSSMASARGVKIRVPVQFFDAPFRVEESPETASVIKTLRDQADISKRVPQPYIIQDNRGGASGPNLLTHLRKEFGSGNKSGITFIVGSAGAGKSVLFNSLFALLYRDFVDQKNRLKPGSRPVPFVPEHLRATYAIRTFALVDSLLRSDVAAPVRRETLEWMLANGCCMWMFDGLDELYSGDPEFFEYMLELITRPDSRAQILVCARDSLLSSNEAFTEFLNNFTGDGSDDRDSIIKVYRLEDWNQLSRRYYAWVELDGRPPRQGETDTPNIEAFLSAIDANQATRELAGLPYYCSLLLERYRQGRPLDVRDEFGLLQEVVDAIQTREIEKGVILVDAFEGDGLDEFIETIATEYCLANYAGSSSDDIRVYSESVLRSDLTDEEREKLLISLVQFPLFSSGGNRGVIQFKHELLAEYLFGKHLCRIIESDPIGAATELAERPWFKETLAFRYLVRYISERPVLQRSLVAVFEQNVPSDKLFKALFQVWISSVVGPKLMPKGLFFEGRDLANVSFENVELMGTSFRHADLTEAVFTSCVLKEAKFEGAYLIGTRFNGSDLEAAQFGNLEHFEYIYAGHRLIEDRESMKKWALQQTGIKEPISDPCPTAYQFRTLFGKFLHEDGSGKRDELPLRALTKGRVYAGAPTPSDCMTASIKNGYLGTPNFRGRVRRTTGDQYDQTVAFMRDWQLSEQLRSMMDELCPLKRCDHVPKDFSAKPLAA